MASVLLSMCVPCPHFSPLLAKPEITQDAEVEHVRSVRTCTAPELCQPHPGLLAPQLRESREQHNGPGLAGSGLSPQPAADGLCVCDKLLAFSGLYFPSYKIRLLNGACQGLGEAENGEFLFNGHRVLVLEDAKGSGNGGWFCQHNITNMLNTTELYT